MLPATDAREPDRRPDSYPNPLRVLATVGVMLAVALPAAPTPATESGGGGAWRLIRFTHRITQHDHDAVEGRGARALQYYPDDSYLAWLDEAAVAGVDSLHSVSSVRMVRPEQKVDPLMELGSRLQAIVAVVYGPRADGVQTALSSVWPVVASRRAQPDGLLRDIVLLAPPSAAPSIAAEPEVLYVGPSSRGLAPTDETSDQIVAGNVTGSSVSPGYEAWLSSLGLDGSGVRVAIVDTGIDHHPDLSSRIVSKVEYSPMPVTGEPVDTFGHGTHVAGIVGGDAAGVSGQRARDSNGFLYGLGVAPKVEFVDQNAIATTTGIFCGEGTSWPPPYGWQRLTHDGLANGAARWNASWWSCEAVGGGYLESSRAMDMLVRDGSWTTSGVQPFTMVSAAGNFGPQAKTIASPWEAKNPIIVGASLNTRDGSPDNVASFSSRGPAADGRILPTVLAPGQHIVSTRSHAGVACNLPYLPDGLLYAACSGTSMASPHVAGAVALVTQWWRWDHAGVDPSPAMAKALLVNTATDPGSANIPNGNEGWGRVNLGALFDPEAQRIYVDQSVVLTEPGENVTYRVAPADPTMPLKVTLAWTDAPAAAGAKPALVNDLDLEVVPPDGSWYLGNWFSGGTSIRGGFPNEVDNVENVFLRQLSGAYTVSVTAANLPGDGALGVGDETDQDFALVISNGVLTQ